jgi:nitrite reductase (NO-forming)
MRTLLSINTFLAIVALALLSCQNTEDPSLKQLHKSNAAQNLSGKDLYVMHCAACHQNNAKGVKGIFPPLKDSDYFLEDPKRAIHNILYGQSEQIKVNGVVYQGIMPAVKMSDSEVVKVVNYLVKDVNKSNQIINLNDVKWVKQNP